MSGPKGPCAKYQNPTGPMGPMSGNVQWSLCRARADVEHAAQALVTRQYPSDDVERVTRILDLLDREIAAEEAP